MSSYRRAAALPPDARPRKPTGANAPDTTVIVELVGGRFSGRPTTLRVWCCLTWRTCEGVDVAVELAELIGQLRSELAEAMRAGADADLRFELGPVELELSVAVDREAKPGAKVKFWVVEMGADVKTSSNTTQRIKLVLDPRRADQPDRKPLIGGTEQAGER